VCAGYTGSLYPGVQQQMIASSPEFSPVLPPASSSSSSSWHDDSTSGLVDRVKSEEVVHCSSCCVILGLTYWFIHTDRYKIALRFDDLQFNEEIT